MPSLMIQPTRAEVTRMFRVLGFTIRTGESPSWFEVAIAADPTLFDAQARNRRTMSNFYSSRVGGPLPAERGEAIYLVPQAVLDRLSDHDRLYYALAVYKQPDFHNPHLIAPPKEAAPSVFISKSYGGGARRLAVRPSRRGGVNDRDGGYVDQGPESLEWGGDQARPGKEEPVATAPTKAGVPVATPGAATAKATELEYDDGFSPAIWSREMSAESAAVDDDHGIEAPELPVSGASQALALTAPEYPQAKRFEPANPGNYRASTTARTINQIVIHITDGGRNINGTVAWFKDPKAKVSAHYIVGLDGEVVQMVAHNDVAWHAHNANGHSIGIEHVASRARGIMPTQAEYCASAALVSWLCQTLGIPADRQHIQGHSEADPSTTHTDCPNSVWNWDYYMDLIASGECKPMPEGAGSAAQSLAVEPHVEASKSTVSTPAKPAKPDVSNDTGYHQSFVHPHQPSAQSMAGPAAAIAGAIAGVAINRIEDKQGAISWHLDQWSGPKRPWDRENYEGTGVWQDHKTTVEGPVWEMLAGTTLAADFEIEWQSNGSSIRNIVISPTATHDWVWASLDVQARIVDEANAFTFSPDTTPVAAIHVRFDYHFHLHLQSDRFCITNLTLFANGQVGEKYDWWKTS